MLRSITLIIILLLPASASWAVTCGDVIDGRITAEDSSVSAETREFAFIVSSKQEARLLLKGLEEQGVRNGFDTVLDVYANTLVPMRATAEGIWQSIEKERGGPTQAITALCTDRDEKIFDLYMRFYDFAREHSRSTQSE